MKLLTFIAASVMLSTTTPTSVNAAEQLKPSATNHQNVRFQFGIVPQQSAMKLAERWLPIFKYLENETGYKFVFKTQPTIPEFEQKVFDKEYDFAYMNPYHYTVFHETSGYEAILKQGEKKIKGIIVTHIDSPIESLQDLEGKTLAFPAPAAFAATVIPQSEAKQSGINIQSQYVSSHESVYKNVAYGNFPAGGGIERTLQNTPQHIRSKLKIIWRTKGYTPHAIAYSPKVPKQVAEKVQAAFMKMNNSPEGKKLLAALKFKSIETATNPDWDDVRALDIKLLDAMRTVSGNAH